MNIMLLDSVTFDPDLVFTILSIIVIIITGISFFLNTKNQLKVLEMDCKNTKENLRKLENSVNEVYTKIENKITLLESKIEHLPTEIITLFQKLK